MNHQEIFDKVAVHLLTQKRASVALKVNRAGREAMACVYRGEDGTKCAIGCLIPDELYDPKLEGYGVATAEVISVLERAGVASRAQPINRGFLCELQAVHDSNSSQPSAFKKELRTLANNYGLYSSVLDQFQESAA